MQDCLGWSLHTSMMRMTGWIRLLTLQLLAHLRIVHLHTRLMHPLQKHLKSKPRGHENTAWAQHLLRRSIWWNGRWYAVSKCFFTKMLCWFCSLHPHNKFVVQYFKLICEMRMNCLIHNAIHYGAQIMMSKLLLLSLGSMSDNLHPISFSLVNLLSTSCVQ